MFRVIHVTYILIIANVEAFSDFYNKWTEMPKVENVDNENVDANEKILFIYDIFVNDK